MVKYIFPALLLLAAFFSQKCATEMHSDVADTTVLKSAIGVSGAFVYMTSLSSANSLGGGIWVTVDSAYSESPSIIAADHPTATKQWVRQEYLETGEINVLWAGALPEASDGNTADKIQKCINLTASNNAATIVFPSDSLFVVTDTLELPNNDVRINGNGASITTSTSANPVFYRTQHDNFTVIENLTFYGAGEAFEYNATASGTQYYEFEIRNCKFLQDSATYAIKLNGAREGKIENCYFENNDGIYRRRTVNTEVINCDFKNTTYSVNDDGDESAFSAGLRVHGGTSLGVDSAFVLKGGDHFELANVMADYCNNPIIIQGMYGGIIQGGYFTSRTANPTILIDTTGTGLSASAQHIKIIGNEILADWSTDSTQTGIKIVGAVHTHIAYNTIHFWTNYGIYDSLSTYTIIDHNRIVPRPTFGQSAGGVYSVNDNSVSRITENNFDTGFGITKSNAKVYNNLFGGITLPAIADSAVTIDSSTVGNPGNIYYGGTSSLTERWGSTGYLKPGAPDTLVFPKPFETNIFGIVFSPFKNIDSTSYKLHIVNAYRDSVFLEFYGTDSATYFYRAIGY
jgi:hypothetical protein